MAVQVLIRRKFIKEKAAQIAPLMAMWNRYCWIMDEEPQEFGISANSR